jgi:hypothetical protein
VVRLFSLQLLATASAEGDKVLNDAMAESYREILEVWQQVHITTLDSRGLRLRPDVSIDDIGDLLTAAAEGLAVRALADRNANVMDHARRRSLFGTFALALLAGCMERRDEATGLSLKETVHSMIYGVSANPGSTGAPTSGAKEASGEG